MAVTIWKNTRPGTAEHTWGAAYIGLSAVGLVYGVVGAGKLAVAGGIALLGGGSAAGPTINFLEGQLNKVNHIMKEKHDWDKLVTLSGNAQQDYQAIQPFLRKVMSTAGEQIRLDGRGRPVIEWLSTINGQQVYVKGIQLGANSYQIEDAWVVK